MDKKFLIIFFIFSMFTAPGFADQPELSGEKSVSPAVLSNEETAKNTSNDDNIAQQTPKLFSLGRSVGASYFHLIDLYDKAIDKPFSALQQEYNDTFQNLNIIDIILDDLNIDGKSRQDLNKLRSNFYNALKNQDLNEIQVAFVRDMFVIFYENLTSDIQAQYKSQGAWLLSLGFYTSFQLESLNTAQEDKILLSGFDKIRKSNTFILPEEVVANFSTVESLDRLTITQSELAELKNNLLKISEYFTNYPGSQPLYGEAKNLAGIWQGVLINPENEKYDIRLVVNKDLTAKMNINGIAGDVLIPNVKIVNNYFTFTFKPFGTEKLYLRFDARLSENMFNGEITDVLGYKGYWVLAKCNENNLLSEEKLDTMTSYVAKIEEKLVKTAVLKENDITFQQSKADLADNIQQNTDVEEKMPTTEIITAIDEITLPPITEPQTPPEQVENEIPVNNVVKEKGFWAKIGDFFKKIF